MRRHAVDRCAAGARADRAGRRSARDGSSGRRARSAAGRSGPSDAAGDCRDVVVEAFGCGLAATLPRGDGRAPAAARLDQPRIPVRRSLGRRPHGAAVAAAAAAADRGTSISRASPPAPAACCASAGSCRAARRVPGRPPRARAAMLARARRRTPPGSALVVSLFCYPNRASAGAARRVGRRRRAGRLPRPRRRGAGALDRWTGGAVPHAGQALVRGRAALSPPFRSSRRTPTTGCFGAATSISCAARTRSCARSGRRGRSSGTSTRRPTTRTCAKLDAFLERYGAGCPHAEPRPASTRSGSVERRATRDAPAPRPGRRSRDAARAGGARAALGGAPRGPARPGRRSWSISPRLGYNFGFPGAPAGAIDWLRRRKPTMQDAAMKIAQEVRAGNVIMVGKDPMVVQKAEFTKSGRNASVVKMKLKNLLSGARHRDRLSRRREVRRRPAREARKCTYSYFADPMYVFMDDEYNQFDVEKDNMDDALPLPRGRPRVRAHVLRRQGDLGRAADLASCAKSPTPSPRSRATRRAR